MLNASNRIRRVAFVGLGDQGTPMAERLLAAGWPLTIHARRPDVVARFEQLGARSAASLRELGMAGDMVAVCVVDDAQVREVVLGSDDDPGILAGMAAGSVLVIHSTVHPDTCRELARLAGERGVAVADAPVSGGRTRSYAGTLTIMVGADPDIYARIEPVLLACASLVRRMGGTGSGQLTKLINNYFTCAHMATAADEVSLIQAFGLDIEAAAEVLPTCSGSSTWFSIIAAEKFRRAPHGKGMHYAMQVLGKDVRLAREMMQAVGVEVAITDDLVTRSLERLLHDADGCNKASAPI